MRKIIDLGTTSGKNRGPRRESAGKPEKTSDRRLAAPDHCRHDNSLIDNFAALLDSAELRCGNRAAVSPAPRGMKGWKAPCRRTTRLRGPPRQAAGPQAIQEGSVGNPRPTNWPALLVKALNEPVVLTVEGAPRDHQPRGGRHSAGNKSTSHSRPPMAQVHGGVIRRPEGAPAREKSAAILCHPWRRPGSILAMGIGPSPV